MALTSSCGQASPVTGRYAARFARPPRSGQEPSCASQPRQEQTFSALATVALLGSAATSAAAEEAGPAVSVRWGDQAVGCSAAPALPAAARSRASTAGTAVARSRAGTTGRLAASLAATRATGVARQWSALRLEEHRGRRAAARDRLVDERRGVGEGVVAVHAELRAVGGFRRRAGGVTAQACGGCLARPRERHRGDSRCRHGVRACVRPCRSASRGGATSSPREASRRPRGRRRLETQNCPPCTHLQRHATMGRVHLRAQGNTILVAVKKARRFEAYGWGTTFCSGELR